MLINFCADYLQTQIKCDQPSTDGYDIENLLTSSNSEYLAYSTIKPPVEINFNFICNIKLSHVLIWPRVGSQKSTGFRIHTRVNNSHFHLLSKGFLDPHHAGILFTTQYSIENQIMIPSNFLKAIIHNNQNTFSSLDNLQLTIVRTDRTVPAISKIEIWGYISLYNKSENVTKISDLINSKQQNLICKSVSNLQQVAEKMIPSSSEPPSQSLVIPEEFLDPITCGMMIQPIILPSGKIIDQNTLDNYGENEALWGRPLSDPFTGISLSDNYKPIFALQLKLKIDKFLSEHANHPDVKQLPRVVGRKDGMNAEPRSLIQSYQRTGSSFNAQHAPGVQSTSGRVFKNNLHHVRKSIRHKLPIAFCHQSRSGISSVVNRVTTKVLTNSSLVSEEMTSKSSIDDHLKNTVENVLSSLKRFSDVKKTEEVKNSTAGNNICNCCESPIFYKLPCNHIVCRKILLSYNSNRSINQKCLQCNNYYKSSDVIKFHN